ncbi:MAG: hypothetical protein WB799_15480 [Candidatus Sulfotelmatobacter sp.]
MMRASLMQAFVIRAFLVRAFLSRAFLSRSGWRAAVTMGVLAVAAMTARAIAQQAASGGVAAPATAMVTFTLDFPESNPEHYSIAVDAAGHARYECTGTITEDSDEETYRAEFQVSAGNRERIFGWAKQAQYFAGKIDSGNHKLASTGTKLLSYQDGQLSNTARYNYSNLAAVQQLTTLFQNMAGTLEYGRRLAYYHRYQKLALDDELKRMEMQARNNELSEIQGVAPVLQEILEDTSVISVVRARAKELMQLGSGPAAGR